ncbi:Translation elongation/initiation factor/Ribosomal, beta-barrel [Ostreococcus tauri]|uniref:Translation elongation/initiation factor/Ribosomal, beta-barrel n=1 Tax=Ostreococcus tauri TaxID=70448 RepID=Q018N7_OSTTA|nr:Translation elongation/initiation factor/Ribosomal, beta-barrel [Ostreococcus tauri]CAL54138.1 Translation elongation/initiation factor/Ribosomal, beta-barrel [Ostreococcus tauri]|eukprot:XP_003079480.1 Translation elongation/initiation factor/Ribosomal, beta-barrel [Ostreococcus tauri]
MSSTARADASGGRSFATRRWNHRRRPLGANVRKSSTTPRASVEDAGDGLVQVGAIVGAHGLRGEVRVLPMTDFIDERFMTRGSTLQAETSAQGRSKVSGEYDAPIGETREVSVRGGRWVTSKGRNDVIVKLSGVDDRTSAEALVGTRLFVSPSDRAPLRDEAGQTSGDGDDEFYAQELQGMRVIDRESGSEVGVVEDVVRGAGTQDLLKVGFSAFDEEFEIDTEFYVYVPFVKDIVPLVDAKNRLMEITPPGGLLDLKTPKKTKAQRAKIAAKAKAASEQ